MKLSLMFIFFILAYSCKKDSSTDSSISNKSQNQVTSETNINTNTNAGSDSNVTNTSTPPVNTQSDNVFKNYSFKIITEDQDRGNLFKFNNYLVELKKDQIIFYDENNEFKALKLNLTPPMTFFDIKVNSTAGNENKSYCEFKNIYRTPTKIYLTYTCSTFENSTYKLNTYIKSISPTSKETYEGKIENFVSRTYATNIHSNGNFILGPTIGEKIIIQPQDAFSNYQVQNNSYFLDPLSEPKITAFRIQQKLDSINSKALTTFTFNNFQILDSGELIYINCNTSPPWTVLLVDSNFFLQSATQRTVNCEDFSVINGKSLLIIDSTKIYNTDKNLNIRLSIETSKINSGSINYRSYVSNKYLFLEAEGGSAYYKSIKYLNYDNFEINSFFDSKDLTYDYQNDPLSKIEKILFRDGKCFYFKANNTKTTTGGSLGQYCITN